MWINGRRCLVDLELTAGDNLEFVIRRAGKSIARITAAFAGGANLGLYTVDAAVVDENSKGLARRGQGSRRTATVLAD